MSRGRKAVVQNNSDWESVFYNSVGTYVQYINLRLAEHIKSEPLSNHIKIVGGYAFKSLQYKKQGIPVIRISDFSNEKIILDDVVYYDESKDLERYELHEGDIVIALTGGTIAKLGIVQKGIGKLYLNQRVGKFEVLNPDEFENEYVYWIARSVQSIIKNLAWGAAIPNVSPKQIEELQFPIPDKETQNGIIDFLNDLRENKLEENREYFNNEVEDYIFSLQVNQISASELQSELHYQEDLVKRLRQAFLQEGMQGKLVKQNADEGNATDLLRKIKAENGKLFAGKSLNKEKDFVSIKDKEIPSNWVWCRLDEIAELKSGNQYSYPKAKQGIMFIKVGDMNLEGNEFEIKTSSTYFESESVNERDLILQRSIIFPKRGGAIATNKRRVVLKEPILVDSNTMAVIPNPEISFNFFLQWFSGVDLSKLGNEGVIPQVNNKDLNPLLIALPPLKEQERIIIKLKELMNLCDEISECITQSKTENERLIKTLLNEALGITSTYDVAKDKTITQKIKKFYVDQENKIFDTINMNIIEILQTSQEPISSTVVWNSSEYKNDIEAFYAELKRLIDIEKLVVEEKRGKESFLKLATNEN